MLVFATLSQSNQSKAESKLNFRRAKNCVTNLIKQTKQAYWKQARLTETLEIDQIPGRK